MNRFNSWNDWNKKRDDISNNSVKYIAVTQQDFFNLYIKILGVTETIGKNKERKDLK